MVYISVGQSQHSCTYKNVALMSDSRQDNTDDLAVTQLDTARQAAAAQQWRTAVRLLRPLAGNGHLGALKLLATVLCSAGRPAAAAEHLAAVTDAHPGEELSVNRTMSHSQRTKVPHSKVLSASVGCTAKTPARPPNVCNVQPTGCTVWPACTAAGDVQLLKQLGDCHLQAGHWQPALVAYQHALTLLREQQQQQHQHQQSAPQGNAEDDAGSPGHHQQQQWEEARSAHVVKDLTLQSCCAAAMYPQGAAHAEAAVHLVQSVMQQQAGRNLPPALKLYAQVTRHPKRDGPVNAYAHILHCLSTDVCPPLLLHR